MSGHQPGQKSGYDDYQQQLGREENKFGGYMVSDSKTRAQTLAAASQLNTTSKKRRHNEMANDDLSLFEAANIAQGPLRGLVDADGIAPYG